MRWRRTIGMLMLCLAMMCQAAPFVVVIDAGHGGKDAGAVGRKVQEKDLNLDVSLRLASKIRTAYPEVKVILTRSSDVFLQLQERANIVNKNKADLFICIHTNAAENKASHGAEVFILGSDDTGKNLDVAMRENAVMKLEADYKTRYQGFDPNSVESYIMFDLMQNMYLDQSLQFASLVQDQFTKGLKREDRGVRQAAFWVLLKSACPSVLVEMGFVSNVDEEKYLASDQGKREITEALFTAFAQYYKPQSKEKGAKSEEPRVESQEPRVKSQEPRVESVAEPAATPTASTASTWRVQLFVSKTILPEGDRNFKGLKGCTYREVNGIYKYMYGNCATRSEAVTLKKSLEEQFPGCFVVEIKN